jgi:hypothetical protein
LFVRVRLDTLHRIILFILGEDSGGKSGQS